MTEYALKREGRVLEEEEREESEEEEEEERKEEEIAGEMKSVLEEAMEEAWRRPEAREMRRRLSKVAKTHWRPQILEAIKATGYSKELQARSREIEYDKKVKKVWE